MAPYVASAVATAALMPGLLRYAGACAGPAQVCAVPGPGLPWPSCPRVVPACAPASPAPAAPFCGWIRVPGSMGPWLNGSLEDCRVTFASRYAGVARGAVRLAGGRLCLALAPAPYAARHLREMSGGVSRHRLRPAVRRRVRRQDRGHRLGRGLPAQRLAGPAVQLISDRGQVLQGCAPARERALGEVLAQQPVGVLVRCPAATANAGRRSRSRSPRPPRSARAPPSRSPDPRSATGASHQAGPRHRR